MHHATLTFLVLGFMVCGQNAQYATAPTNIASQQRAQSCTVGPDKPQNNGVWHTKKCPNLANVGIYDADAMARGQLNKIDTMRSTNSWFACQRKTAVANPALGSGKNHYWLWTQGDDNHAWGWFPANGVLIGGQEAPIPGVSLCDQAKDSDRVVEITARPLLRSRSRISRPYREQQR